MWFCGLHKGRLLEAGVGFKSDEVYMEHRLGDMRGVTYVFCGIKGRGRGTSNAGWAV
jgi:hypothetical protein